MVFHFKDWFNNVFVVIDVNCYIDVGFFPVSFQWYAWFLPEKCPVMFVCQKWIVICWPFLCFMHNSTINIEGTCLTSLSQISIFKDINKWRFQTVFNRLELVKDGLSSGVSNKSIVGGELTIRGDYINDSRANCPFTIGWDVVFCDSFFTKQWEE